MDKTEPMASPMDTTQVAAISKDTPSSEPSVSEPSASSERPIPTGDVPPSEIVPTDDVISTEMMGSVKTAGNAESEKETKNAKSDEPRESIRLPMGLFLATWLSVLVCRLIPDPTFLAFGKALWAAISGHGSQLSDAVMGIPLPLWEAFGHSCGMSICYAVPIMTILICHEAGHQFMARKYRLNPSWPCFIPLPISIVGTMGAVFQMDPDAPDRRATFDTGISGPIAGLIPALIFCWFGLKYSYVAQMGGNSGEITLGEPIIFQGMIWLQYGNLPDGAQVVLHPIAFAGWVGLLLTSLNLFPISQLDGGHVLYSLVPRYAYRVSVVVHRLACLAILIGVLWLQRRELMGWLLFLGVLAWMGLSHPATRDDSVPLGKGRVILGWTSLAMLLVCFTPFPIR